MSTQAQLEQRSIPFEKIETNTCGFVNPRTYLGDVSELKTTIKEQGLLSNPTVWETTVKGKSHYVVLMGHRRIDALTKIREEAEAEGTPGIYDELTCSVYQGDLEGAMAIALLDHLQHKSLNPADIAQAVAKLVEKTGNQTKAGEILAIKQPTVSGYLNLYRGAIPAVLEALRVQQIKLNQAKKIAALLNADKTPNAEAQEAELERLLHPPTEADAQDGTPARQRTKTYRSKREVEELRTQVAQMDKECGEVDAEYRQNLGKFIKWFFCQVESEAVIFSSPEAAASAPKVDQPAEVPAVEEKPKKRRIATQEA